MFGIVLELVEYKFRRVWEVFRTSQDESKKVFRKIRVDEPEEIQILVRNVLSGIFKLNRVIN
jgi:hypothetical protein